MAAFVAAASPAAPCVDVAEGSVVAASVTAEDAPAPSASAWDVVASAPDAPPDAVDVVVGWADFGVAPPAAAAVGARAVNAVKRASRGSIAGFVVVVAPVEGWDGLAAPALVALAALASDAPPVGLEPSAGSASDSEPVCAPSGSTRGVSVPVIAVATWKTGSLGAGVVTGVTVTGPVEDAGTATSWPVDVWPLGDALAADAPEAGPADGVWPPAPPASADAAAAWLAAWDADA
jgi:hypothetical protein